MMASKGKNVVAALDAKRRLKTPLMEAQKAEKVIVEAKRKRKIWRMTVDDKN